MQHNEGEENINSFETERGQRECQRETEAKRNETNLNVYGRLLCKIITINAYKF